MMLKKSYRCILWVCSHSLTGKCNTGTWQVNIWVHHKCQLAVHTKYTILIPKDVVGGEKLYILLLMKHGTDAKIIQVCCI
jgi:hypothetical protein